MAFIECKFLLSYFNANRMLINNQLIITVNKLLTL